MEAHCSYVVGSMRRRRRLKGVAHDDDGFLGTMVELVIAGDEHDKTSTAQTKREP
jgi:hypothetical protein